MRGSTGCVGTGILLLYIANGNIAHNKNMAEKLLAENPQVVEMMHARDVLWEHQAAPEWRIRRLETGDYPEAAEYRNALKTYETKATPDNNRALSEVLRYKFSENTYATLGFFGIFFGACGLVSIGRDERRVYEEDDGRWY